MKHAFYSFNVDKPEIQISNPPSSVDFCLNKMAILSNRQIIQQAVKFLSFQTLFFNFASIQYVYFHIP